MQQIRYNKKINPSAILIEDGKVIIYVFDLENELGEYSYTMEDFQRWGFNKQGKFLRDCWDHKYSYLSDQEIEEFINQIDISAFERIVMEVKYK
ncbi:MAG: hypothetical protein LLF98_02440 [Clostridium sp.]|uniref:hypothetical protein n=1 Tax=Clostridium sp. TaxID=1506 RepID=UPI0025BF3659|nr:hypothetical protein [Clostridium sp.]MCE5220141.1 hypothetical protein [Clostridium sp.]